MGAPVWMQKHPCTACGTGYGMCAQGLAHSLKCCKDCAHPGRWEPDPWTADDLIEMWSGRDMPDYVQESVRRLANRAQREDEK